ncbi:MAG: putative zinc-binding metallopeptidase [Bacteroidales bacterium]|jgi:substrate import-associated zinc metallohydrolase lipoprotein|nr:putative zinc-binding metallopeptidase [Bacteroidales bacterium]
MKKIIHYFLAIFTVVAFHSCEKDEPDGNNSIFDTSTPELNSFDVWLRENYVAPYNIRVYYQLRDIETDFDYNVIPADFQKAKQMAFLLKYLWLEAYEEVAADGVHFVRANAPRIMHYLGSAEWSPDVQTMRLGVAEGGLKITISEVNDLIPKQISSQRFFNTIHHEFGHILNQAKNYSTDFQKISAGKYMPAQWQLRGEAAAAADGFVSSYGGSQPEEDFVEVLARYITYTPAQWNAKLTQAGETGGEIILTKLNIVKKYMQDMWGVDIDELKAVIQRRANEIQFMDFDNLGF